MFTFCAALSLYVGTTVSRLAFLGATSPFTSAAICLGKRFTAAIKRLAATTKDEGRGVLAAILASTSRRWMEDWMARCCPFENTRSDSSGSKKSLSNGTSTTIVDNIEWTKQITGTMQVEQPAVARVACP